MPFPSVHVSMPRPGRVALLVPVLVAPLVLGACERPGVSSGPIALDTSAGTVTVECIDGDFARVLGADPAGGFTARVIVEGPSNEVSVSFESPAATDVRVAIRCRGGQITVEEFDDEDLSIPPEGG